MLLGVAIFLLCVLWYEEWTKNCLLNWKEWKAVTEFNYAANYKLKHLNNNSFDIYTNNYCLKIWILIAMFNIKMCKIDQIWGNFMKGILDCQKHLRELWCIIANIGEYLKWQTLLKKNLVTCPLFENESTEGCKLVLFWGIVEAMALLPLFLINKEYLWSKQFRNNRDLVITHIWTCFKS